MAHKSRTHTFPVPFTASLCPSAPLITISDLGVASTLRAFACHAGIRLTEAPVSKRTVVASILLQMDFGGTLWAILRLYAGTVVFLEVADLTYSVADIEYSERCTLP